MKALEGEVSKLGVCGFLKRYKESGCSGRPTVIGFEARQLVDTQMEDDDDKRTDICTTKTRTYSFGQFCFAVPATTGLDTYCQSQQGEEAGMGTPTQR